MNTHTYIYIYTGHGILRAHANIFTLYLLHSSHPLILWTTAAQKTAFGRPECFPFLSFQVLLWYALINGLLLGMFGFHVRSTSSGCQGFHHLKAHMGGQIVVTKMVYKYMIHVLGDRWWSSATIHPWLPMMLTGFAGWAVCPSPLLRFYHLFYLRWSPAPENQVRLATLIHRHFIPSISPGKGLKTCGAPFFGLSTYKLFIFEQQCNAYQHCWFTPRFCCLFVGQ